MPYKGTPEERREKHRKYMAARYANDEAHRDAHKRQVKRQKPIQIARLKTLLEPFRAGGCHFCAEHDPCCLEAHHKDPSQKLFEIAGAIGGARYGKAAIEAELAKCVCVCANCHRKIHAGILTI